MRRVDMTNEFLHVVSQLDLRPGEIVIDTQSEPDSMLHLIQSKVGPHGRVVGLAFGAKTVDALEDHVQGLTAEGIEGIETRVGHPLLGTKMRTGSCHGVILRHVNGLKNVRPVFAEMYRVTRPGGRVAALHTEWHVYLPRMTDLEREMAQNLNSPAVKDGHEFLKRLTNAPREGWRDIRYDIYSVSSRDARASVRYGYDWRSLLRDRLTAARVYSPRQILDFIDRLQKTRGAKVSVDRYYALAIKR